MKKYWYPPIWGLTVLCGALSVISFLAGSQVAGWANITIAAASFAAWLWEK